MNENKYDAFELERKSTKKKFIILLLIGIAIIVVGAVLGFTVTEVLLLVFGLIGLFFIVSSFAIRMQFNKKFKENVISVLVKEELGEDAVYNPTGGINLNLIMSHKMYEHPDRHTTEDYIKATYNGVEYSMCDAHFQERHVTHDSKGNRRVEYVTYFKGRIIYVNLNRGLNTRLKIVEGHPKGFNKQGMEKFETELIDFNKKYDTYVNDKEKAFYMLTPVMLQKLLELEKLFKGSIQYSFEDNSFMVFINNNGDSLEVSLGKKLDEKNLDIYRGQIKLAATIINEFKLDSDKYQTEIKI